MSRLPQSTDTLDSLPIKVLTPSKVLYRVSSTKHQSPVFFSKFSGNRWTPQEGEPGICYFSLSQTGAIAETVCRNAAFLEESEKHVSLIALSKLGMYSVGFDSPIRVLDFTVSNLGRYRLDAGILADYDPGREPPYKFCPAWSSHAVSLGLDGILYRSRHAVDEFCLALFQNAYTDNHSVFSATCLDYPDYLAILDDVFDWAID
tara:strand:- start:488 stop:1099 length:612 start_codon:yes stop_codon:yes gene_type:complete